jgi:RNA polymerase sigma-70 factor, ECF subfamily
MSQTAGSRTLWGMTGFEARRDAEFSRCFEQEMPRLLRYAQRHVGHELAQDVVAETFQIAWRKWDKVPDERFPWLVGTARKVIGNHVRATIRRRRLATRLALFTEVTADSTVEAAARIGALHLLAALSEAEREALLLMAWDGLTSDDAARVLGISPAAFRKRLSRARQSVLTAENSQQDTAAMTIGAEDAR